MKILIVDDEKDICLFLKNTLENAGYSIDYSQSGERGSFLAKTNVYDLVILDVNIPDRSGYEICKDIRTDGKLMPILILTVETEVLNKVQLLDAGADDYLTKPFSVPELLARVKTLLRRPLKIEKIVIEHANLKLIKERNSIIRNKKETFLTRKEYMLLEHLLQNRGKIVSRAEIIDHVWDQEADIFSNTIETHILNLRKKLGKDKDIIKTFSGRGYGII